MVVSIRRTCEFVVDLDRGLTETMLDAGALDPRRELAADLLGELGSDPVAEEGGDVFGFDGQDGLPGKLFIEGLRMAGVRNTSWPRCIRTRRSGPS